MKYQYWQAVNRAWCWHLKGGGQVVAHGEGYVDEADVLRAIDLERRSVETKVRFAAQDGRVVTTTMSNSSVDSWQKSVPIRYDPRDPGKAIEDSNIIPYAGAVTILIGAGMFLRFAWLASLHNGRKYFM
jgi:uncharacterized protein YegP (UPF0339 family)